MPYLGDESDELAADTEPVESGQGNHRKKTTTKGKKNKKTTAKKQEKPQTRHQLKNLLQRPRSRPRPRPVTLLVPKSHF